MSSARTALLYSAEKDTVYTLHFPENLLGFCSYDFSKFQERCLKLCERCESIGEYDTDEAARICDMLNGCHCFYKNERGIFGDIALDFIIFCLCRGKKLSYEAFRNELTDFDNDFQRQIFTRLTAYRFKQAVNSWELINSARDYAREKLKFIYSGFDGADRANARRKYFDRIFSAAAENAEHFAGEFGSVTLYGIGRPAISDGDVRGRVPAKFDGAAAETFRRIKESGGFKAKAAVFGTESAAEPIYRPESLFSAIDLELELLGESGLLLRSCGGCGGFYLYSGEPEERCKHCRIRAGSAEYDPVMKKLGRIYMKIHKTVGKGTTQSDFERWMGLYEKLLHDAENGTVGSGELERFERLSSKLLAKR